MWTNVRSISTSLQALSISGAVVATIRHRLCDRGPMPPATPSIPCIGQVLRLSEQNHGELPGTCGLCRLDLRSISGANSAIQFDSMPNSISVSYTHLRAHETDSY